MRNNGNIFLHNLQIIASFSFSLLLHHHLINCFTASDSPPSDVIPDLNYVTLACGLARDAKARDGRTWAADTNSKFFSVKQNEESRAVESLTTKFFTPPYTTARISRYPFTYIFPVATGRIFIRLHFSPASYLDFNISKAFFSVQADHYILLSNFSAALQPEALDMEPFFREFWLNVEDDRILNLTFTPSFGMDDVYAFINGIEMASVPTNLYHTAGDNPGLKFVGQNKPVGLENNAVSEVMYRINVGGAFISPLDDSVLFRSWLSDEDYLTIAEPSAFLLNSTIQLRYTIFTRFAAPDLLYKTGRSMGMDRETNENYNITWEFQVDSGSTYFIRLHFCEFQPPITQKGDRVFQIYIANQLAESEADIIDWSGGNGFPTFRDYAVTMGAGGSKKLENLSIALHPAVYTVYSDAILNGIEIFKWLKSEIQATSIPTSAKPLINRTIVFAIVVGVVLGFIIVIPLLLFFIARRRVKDKDSEDRVSWLPQFVSLKETTKIHRSYSLSNVFRSFSLEEMKAATKNFDNLCIIGVGGFGNVYRGTINDDPIIVAVKRLSRGSEQGENEFNTEIEMLSELRHLHLVSLIGYCNEDHEMILVYDYMSNGTLRDHLYNTSNPPLPWKQRLEICLGAACGLHYLHSGTKHAIVHRDVKSTNILLDENWVAKVSDFGLSKMLLSNNSKSHVTTVVKGSYGYLDPEYYRRQQLTEKSDVYSFGVVLFEVLCGRPAVDRTFGNDYDEQVSLAVWARECYCKGTLNQIIDPFLKCKIAPGCFKVYSEIAVTCLLDERIKRPSMRDVVARLELALQLQESAEDNLKLGGSHEEVDHFDLDMPFMVSSDILSLLKTSVDDSCGKFSIEDSCGDIVEMHES
ncbi:receptor-like protein kinase FERONIA [Manihot esculenta]|nr:receptor-like protein kinase FERONIA [Manihot esculenta]